jgi:PelA/Pel-15E family pectate lyase
MTLHTILHQWLALTLAMHCIPAKDLAQNDAEQAKPTKLSVSAESDYLALRVKGKAAANTTAIHYRWTETGQISESAEWQPVTKARGVEGDFHLEIPLEHSRWSELQVRAMQGEKIVSLKKLKPEPRHRFELLTTDALSKLPEEQRKPWDGYLQRSIQRAEHDYDVMAEECRRKGLASSRPAASDREELELDSDTPDSWFASAEAVALAEVLISYQTPTGGWSKAVATSAGKRPAGTHWTTQSGDGWHYCGTLDNRSTTEQIKVLSGVYSATKKAEAKQAALRGIDYLLEAQYPNGGWPQNYPIEPGYHEAITLNDNAMLHVLELLLTVSEGTHPFTFVEEPLRQRAKAAFEHGLPCLATAQVRVNDKPTVWCAQHHPLTLAPESARAKEPASLSGSESNELLKFLMRKAPLRADITAMIEPALAWLEAHRITGLRKTKNDKGKTDYLPDPNSTEVYWARFYDVSSGKPVFAGAQDGIVYSTYSEMASKNKVSYDYFTTKPQELLTKEVVRWKKRKK